MRSSGAVKPSRTTHPVGEKGAARMRGSSGCSCDPGKPRTTVVVVRVMVRVVVVAMVVVSMW